MLILKLVKNEASPLKLTRKNILVKKKFKNLPKNGYFDRSVLQVLKLSKIKMIIIFERLGNI